jgi:hypothetical protein
MILSISRSKNLISFKEIIYYTLTRLKKLGMDQDENKRKRY